MQGLVEILALPLVGAITIMVSKDWLPRRWAGIWASLLVGVTFILALDADIRLGGLPAAHRVLTGVLATWVSGYGPPIDWRLYLDPLAGVWLLVITGVGALIHVYSIGYMQDDPGEARFFAYLNFFVFAMLLLVLAGNLLVLLIGWALVGLASYWLIGFWYQRPTAVYAAKKAFVMNTLGDAAIIVGIVLLYLRYHTTGYASLFAAFSHVRPGAAFFEWAAVLLYIGAMAKSAQFPLHMWLADAMEGPTPVSALIHAATMVTAGVYLMARLYPLLRVAPGVAYAVAAIGAFTAIFAASIAFFQQDIKRGLAYSTLSQLGYMMLAVGIGAYTAGVFHFMTHAFFKALLFLAAGSVIHGLAGEQDLGQMGGLARKMPVTMWTFLVGTVAISGIPPLSGYFSKEAILAQAYHSGHWILWAVGVVTAGMTAFYMFRLFFLTFLGEPRNRSLYDHAHESPTVMTGPLLALAGLAVVGGFFGTGLERWLAPSFAAYPGAAAAGLEEGPLWTTGVTVGLAVVGIGVAYWLYVARRLRPDAGLTTPAGRFLYAAWRMDAVWTALVVDPLKMSGRAVQRVERRLIWAVEAIGRLVWMWAEDLRPLQTGLTRRYALSIMVGTGAVLAYYLIRIWPGSLG